MSSACVIFSDRSLASRKMEGKFHINVNSWVQRTVLRFFTVPTKKWLPSRQGTEMNDCHLAWVNFCLLAHLEPLLEQGFPSLMQNNDEEEFDLLQTQSVQGHCFMPGPCFHPPMRCRLVNEGSLPPSLLPLSITDARRTNGSDGEREGYVRRK